MGFKSGKAAELEETDFRKRVAEATSLSNFVAGMGCDPGSEGTRMSVISRLVELRIEPLHWANNPLAALEKNYLRRYDKSKRKSRPTGYRVAYNWVCPGDHCELCDLGPIWRGEPTVFEIDHIDGDAWHCERVNLRRLCPNCHRQQSTSSADGGILFGQ